MLGSPLEAVRGRDVFLDGVGLNMNFCCGSRETWRSGGRMEVKGRMEIVGPGYHRTRRSQFGAGVLLSRVQPGKPSLESDRNEDHFLLCPGLHAAFIPTFARTRGGLNQVKLPLPL